MFTLRKREKEILKRIGLLSTVGTLRGLPISCDRLEVTRQKEVVAEYHIALDAPASRTKKDSEKRIGMPKKALKKDRHALNRPSNE